MKCEVFEGLAALRRDSRIGPAVRGCFELLWHLSGGRADYIVVTTKRIAFEFGVERRTVEGWLKKLQEYGLIEIVDRDTRRGTIHVYVFHPRPDRREPRPDPQRRLDFGTAESLGLYARKPAGGQSETNICARESPGEQSETNVCARESPAGDNMSARARLSLCLVFLSSSTDDNAERQKEIRDKANEIRNAIFAHRPYAKADTETKRVIAVAAAIAVTAGAEWAEWVAYAVAVTARKKADAPGAYLRQTLRHALVEFAGISETYEEAGSAIGKLFRAVRPLIRPILAGGEKGTAAAAGQEAGGSV